MPLCLALQNSLKLRKGIICGGGANSGCHLHHLPAVTWEEWIFVCVCLCVCVWVRERNGGRGGCEGAVGQRDADLSQWRFEHLHTVGGQMRGATQSWGAARPPGRRNSTPRRWQALVQHQLFSSHTLTNPKAAELAALITESLAVTTWTCPPLPFNPLPLNHKKIHFLPSTSKEFQRHQVVSSSKAPSLFEKHKNTNQRFVSKCNFRTKNSYIRCTDESNKSKTGSIFFWFVRFCAH